MDGTADKEFQPLEAFSPSYEGLQDRMDRARNSEFNINMLAQPPTTPVHE
jgi:hypothetical protein